MNKLRILILGVTGMLGHKLFQHLSSYEKYRVFGTMRGQNLSLKPIFPSLWTSIISGVDAANFDSLSKIIHEIKPQLLINCIGIIKQGELGQDPASNIYINSLLPHKIAGVCRDVGARMLHFSTDSVFSDKKGSYSESDFSDADDIYGRSKYLGEVDYPHCLTIRTSIIGHEIVSQLSLLEWFLAQEGSIYGYTRHIFTGLPTVVLAGLLASYVIPDGSLKGIYHLSSDPISKYNLLKLVAKKYNKNITINPDDSSSCNRSLDSLKLRRAVNLECPSWPDMVDDMFEDFIKTGYPAKSKG